MMATQPTWFRNITAGAVAGAAWFVLPLFLDYGVEDMQDIRGIPSGVGPMIAAVCCAMATGAIIAAVFWRCIRDARGFLFFILPVATLPTAIIIFTLLLWCIRQFFGIHTQRPPLGDLGEILTIYLVYGLISLFAPILYGFALLTQYIFRRLLTREERRGVGPHF